jgi:hypothetical protein
VVILLLLFLPDPHERLSYPAAHLVVRRTHGWRGDGRATADGTAKVSRGDYTAASGPLTFTPGQTSKTITIKTKGDRKKEVNETFFLNLLSATGADFEDGQGVGTILNDD